MGRGRVCRGGRWRGRRWRRRRERREFVACGSGQRVVAREIVPVDAKRIRCIDVRDVVPEAVTPEEIERAIR